MNITPTTTRPYRTADQLLGTGILENLTPSPIEFLQSKLAKYPFLQLKPSSLLAKVVVYQYQQGTTATTDRPEWPEELCGYIEAVAALAELDKINLDEFNPKIDGVPDSKYAQDECITPTGTIEYTSDVYEAGVQRAVTLPGTLAYAQCETEDLIEDLYDVDWTGYFASPVFPSIDSLSEEDKAAVTEGAGLTEKIGGTLLTFASDTAGIALGDKNITAAKIALNRLRDTAVVSESNDGPQAGEGTGRGQVNN